MKRIVNFVITFCITLVLSIGLALPSLSHWADLSVAEIVVEPQQVQIDLTLPTGLVNFADQDRNNQISKAEFDRYRPQLTQFLATAIQVTDRNRNPGSLVVSYGNELPKNNQLSAPQNTHSTLNLQFSFPKPLQGLTIDYQLFLPGVPTATCLATILTGQKGEQFIFSPTRLTYTASVGSASVSNPFGLQDNFWLAVIGAFVWGGMHALSPGHGKTLVGAYLIGERSTWLHALVLGMTTTFTHTIGVVCMGLVALLAAQFFAPEAIFPWLSLVAGVGVLAIGVHLCWQRWHKKSQGHSHDHNHHSDHHHLPADHTHDHHEHSHHHHLPAGHVHDHHEHSHHDHHSPESLSWRNLIALGIAGGLTPCPAALVLMLGAISLHQIGLGLGLVLCFSLGLALALVGLGLLLIGAKRWFQLLPISANQWRFLPLLSAFCITLLGLVSTLQAIRQIVS